MKAFSIDKSSFRCQNIQKEIGLARRARHFLGHFVLGRFVPLFWQNKKGGALSATFDGETSQWIGMHKRPLAVISVFFIIGIVLGRFLPDSVNLIYIFAVNLIFILLCLLFTLTCRGRVSNPPLQYG